MRILFGEKKRLLPIEADGILFNGSLPETAGD